MAAKTEQTTVSSTKAAPEHNTQKVGDVVEGIRLTDNKPAAYAFFAALGSSWNHFSGADVCHIWPGTAFDPNHFTRLADLAGISRTLWRFTDWEPVEAAFKRRAFELYGYRGPAGVAPPKPREYLSQWEEPVDLA